MQKRVIPYLLLTGIIFLFLAPAVHADDASEWYVKGQNAAITGNYETALQYYNNALAADKNHVAAQSGKAYVLNKLGRYEEALASADSVLAVKKEPVAAEARAFALYSLGRYEESAAAYDLLFTVRQNIPEAYCTQGRAYQQLGMTTEAIASFGKCTKLDPMNLDGWNQQGLMYLSLGRYDAALEAFNRCTRITQTNAVIWNNKGLAYAGLLDYPNAMSCFKTAINLDPSFEEARRNLDKAYERKPFFTTTITPAPVATTPALPEPSQPPGTGPATPILTTEVPSTFVSPDGAPPEETQPATTTYAPVPLSLVIAGVLAGAGIFCRVRQKRK